MNKDKIGSEIIEKGNLPKEKKEKKEKMISVTYRESRKYDLHIGRNVKTFRGRQTQLIPESWINHFDWEREKKFFIVREGGK